MNEFLNNLAVYLLIFLACLLASWMIYNRDKKKIEEQTRDLQLMFNIARAIGSSLELKLLVANAARILLPLIGGDRFALLMPDGKGGYTVNASVGWERIEGLSELAAGTTGDKIVVRGDQVVLPLPAKGKISGILLLGADNQLALNGRVKNLLSAAADQLAIAVENAGLYEREKQAVTRLTELDRLRSEFISMVSHELRTPIAAADGYVSLFLAGVTGPVSDDQKKYLAIIKDNNQRLLSLIDRLLDFSGIETGRFAIKRELISINEIIAEAEKLARPRLDARGARLNLELNAVRVNFMGDRERMLEVFEKLIDNALKFSGGARPEIGIATRDQGQAIEVSVADNGSGIEPEHLEAIFNEFYQVDATLTREAGGVGLGLTIVREIINKHHGRIWAESAGKGKGARFVFDLPAAEKVRS